MTFHKIHNSALPSWQAIVCWALIPIAFLLRFSIHLKGGALFWDEWIYIREIQNSATYFDWILAPSTAHIFIIPKLLNVLLYHYFGVWFLPYKIASFAIHGATAIVLYKLLRLEVDRKISLLITTVFVLTTSYEEILAWSAHYREQCFILLFFLWMYWSFKIITKKTHRPRADAIMAALAFIAMTFSFANILFGCMFGVLFIIFYYQHLKRSPALPLMVGTLLLCILAYGYIFAGPLSQQAALQAPREHVQLVDRLWLTVGNCIYFLKDGVFSRIFSPVNIPWLSPIFACGAVAVGILATKILLARSNFLSIQFSLWFLLCALIVATLQVWYRPNLQFILSWNKYSFLPIAMLLPSLAIFIRALPLHFQGYMSVLLLATVFLRGMPGIRSNYTSLTGSHAVETYIDDFYRIAVPLSSTAPTLLDINLPWPVFIPDYSPTPSLLWRSHPNLRQQKANFVETSAALDPEQHKLLKNSAEKAPELKNFYSTYGPKFEAPAAGDGGVIFPKNSSELFVQELKNPSLSTGFLRGITVVFGTAPPNKSLVEIGLFNADYQRFFEERRAAEALINNTPTDISVPQTVIKSSSFYIGIRVSGENFEKNIAAYKTKLSLPHLGSTWICNRDEMPKTLTLDDCQLQDRDTNGALGVGLSLYSFPDVAADTPQEN